MQPGPREGGGRPTPHKACGWGEQQGGRKGGRLKRVRGVRRQYLEGKGRNFNSYTEWPTCYHLPVRRACSSLIGERSGPGDSYKARLMQSLVGIEGT